MMGFKKNEQMLGKWERFSPGTMQHCLQIFLLQFCLHTLPIPIWQVISILLLFPTNNVSDTTQTQEMVRCEWERASGVAP